jgi:hypothetical protein
MIIVSEPTALRYVSWPLNAALLALCGFLVARTAGAVYDALRRSPPILVGAVALTPVPRELHSWSDREVILTRNLFNASLLAPAEAPPPPEEEVEETELPLGLLGTISSPRSEIGWAAVWNAESRESLVVTPGNEIGDGLATVLRIERERVLLSENGAIRELVLGEDGEYRPPKRPPPRIKSRASKRRSGRRGRR